MTDRIQNISAQLKDGIDELSELPNKPTPSQGNSSVI